MSKFKIYFFKEMHESDKFVEKLRNEGKANQLYRLNFNYGDYYSIYVEANVSNPKDSEIIGCLMDKILEIESWDGEENLDSFIFRYLPELNNTGWGRCLNRWKAEKLKSLIKEETKNNGFYGKQKLI